MIKPGERYACKIWTIISQCSLTELANSFFQVSDHHVPDISALRPCCSRHDLPLLSMLRERPIFKHLHMFIEKYASNFPLVTKTFINVKQQ